MKNTLAKLQINDVVTAQIVEAVAPGEFVVSFGGDLVRVKNSTALNFKPDQHVLLRVIAIRPLQFQLANNNVRSFDWHV